MAGVTVKVATPEASSVAVPKVVVPEVKTTGPVGGTVPVPERVAVNVRGWPVTIDVEEAVRTFVEACNWTASTRPGDVLAKFCESPA